MAHYSNQKKDLRIFTKDIFPNDTKTLCSLKTEEEWLTTKEAAAYLKIPTSTLWTLSSNGKVPYYKLGRSNRYALADLRNLLLSQKRGGFYGN
ncbi:helix-turn-helix domain-containing protein [Bdellovibrio sp. ZAP7]|uniref:helix-turn-helix domain-containing protein n=1 Tax=Bdellovibrio sp. ZAP7 TaxID=2231053 RepID=UPI00143D08A7|nr:helix-turn-helix domain-containing protein [Bdellovibrio sp. ZAP7]